MTAILVKDSIEHFSNDFNNKTTQLERRGKLIRGPVNSNGSVPTIPSKYLTVITDNNDTKGFQRSSKRFQYSFSDTPGPGSYTGITDLKESIKKTSDSKKGYGNFASSTSRSEIKLNPQFTPGAGTYETQNTVVNKKKDFSNGFSASFQKPIAQKIEKENEIPAPNSYDLTNATKKILFKSNNVTADSAFKSKTKREFISLEKVKDLPAPNLYNVNDEQLYGASKIPYSSFKSTSQRHTFTPNGFYPGPGEYRPNEPITEVANRQLFPRRHYLAISAPAVPMAPDLPLPGPGTYEVRDFKDPEKKYMSSAAFVSSTGRGIQNYNYSSKFPGPANYSPAKLTKQSFHYNFERKWI